MTGAFNSAFSCSLNIVKVFDLKCLLSFAQKPKATFVLAKLSQKVKYCFKKVNNDMFSSTLTIGSLWSQSLDSQHHLLGKINAMGTFFSMRHL